MSLPLGGHLQEILFTQFPVNLLILGYPLVRPLKGIYGIGITAKGNQHQFLAQVLKCPVGLPAREVPEIIYSIVSTHKGIYPGSHRHTPHPPQGRDIGPAIILFFGFLITEDNERGILDIKGGHETGPFFIDKVSTPFPWYRVIELLQVSPVREIVALVKALQYPV